MSWTRTTRKARGGVGWGRGRGLAGGGRGGRGAIDTGWSIALVGWFDWLV